MLKNKMLRYITMLTFRITVDDDETVRNIFKDKEVIISKEGRDGEKNCQQEHYHGILYEGVTRQTLRNWILDGFGDVAYEVKWNCHKNQMERGKPKGNKFYSISKTQDDDEGLEGFERYVCKGLKDTTPDIIINSRGIDTQARYEAYWRVNDTLTKGRKEKNKSYKQMFKDYIIGKYVCNDSTRVKIGYSTLVWEYMEFCIENEVEPTPRNSGQTMFLYLLSKLNGTQEDAERERWSSYYYV